MGEGRRYRGLLIGNATFPLDPHALPDLNGPGVDIEQLKQVLTDERVGLFRTDDLRKLPDHGIQNIRGQIDGLFTTATREDVLLLYCRKVRGAGTLVRPLRLVVRGPAVERASHARPSPAKNGGQRW
ncbi:hypothetical protein GCM10010211_47360 [Streptomyces albospinus]|uniref:Uncharacterized protein n=1 Tax=Streptomyces albospinus TaxID=285515 RepID=A0ABQ2VA64_9ACTN|nr:hypothetical protein [Streptomyces albospinus]GGU75937.1 hypothetical protein GCM10010211_47360 [Streptomyces albospinus]